MPNKPEDPKIVLIKKSNATCPRHCFKCIFAAVIFSKGWRNFIYFLQHSKAACNSLGKTSEWINDFKCKVSLLSGVHQQAEADQDDQKVDIGGLIPGFMHRVVNRLWLVG